MPVIILIGDSWMKEHRIVMSVDPNQPIKKYLVQMQRKLEVEIRKYTLWQSSDGVRPDLEKGPMMQDRTWAMYGIDKGSTVYVRATRDDDPKPDPNAPSIEELKKEQEEKRIAAEQAKEEEAKRQAEDEARRLAQEEADSKAKQAASAEKARDDEAQRLAKEEEATRKRKQEEVAAVAAPVENHHLPVITANSHSEQVAEPAAAPPHNPQTAIADHQTVAYRHQGPPSNFQSDGQPMIPPPPLGHFGGPPHASPPHPYYPQYGFHHSPHDAMVYPSPAAFRHELRNPPTSEVEALERQVANLQREVRVLKHMHDHVATSPIDDIPDDAVRAATAAHLLSIEESILRRRQSANAAVRLYEETHWRAKFTERQLDLL